MVEFKHILMVGNYIEGGLRFNLPYILSRPWIRVELDQWLTQLLQGKTR
jgi:hypothetical protein